MRVERRGDGDPEVAVVGGVHGDEPCGRTAIERAFEADLTYERPVVFVVANEAALSAGVRAVDEDLNRTFSGDPDGDTHESRLAAEIASLVEGCETLSLHSTQSYERAFAIASGVDEWIRRVVPRLSVDALVDAGAFDRGRIFAVADRAVEVECGYQGSARAEDNATQVVREFLAATGAVDADGASPAAELPLYELTRSISKSSATEYEVHVPNFERVEAGEPFAAIDDDAVVAQDDFYPVLMSAYGYDELFGYAAEYQGTVP